MELYSQLWSIVESIGFIIVIIIFFMDPVRRWNFFGYRPTAVIGLFDPHLGQVLMVKVNGAWSFNQGGMYQNNIYLTVINILKRELGISETRFKLIYTQPLGAITIKNKQLLRRARISTISIFNHLRGKGYLGCFVRSNLKNIETEIHRGAGIQDSRIVAIAEAKKLACEFTTGEHQPAKQKMILAMLQEIEQFASGVKEWESQHLLGDPDAEPDHQE